MPFIFRFSSLLYSHARHKARSRSLLSSADEKPGERPRATHLHPVFYNMKEYLQNEKSIILSLLQSLESKGKNSDNIDTIIEEEDESNIISQTYEKHSRLQTGKIFGSKNRKSVLSELNKKNTKYMSTRKNSLDNIGKINELNVIENKEENEKNNDSNSVKDSNKDNNLENIEKNLEIKNDINKVDDVINIVDKEIKNSSLKNQIHN